MHLKKTQYYWTAYKTATANWFEDLQAQDQSEETPSPTESCKSASNLWKSGIFLGIRDNLVVKFTAQNGDI